MTLYIDPWSKKYYELCFLSNRFARLKLFNSNQKDDAIKVGSVIFNRDWEKVELEFKR